MLHQEEHTDYEAYTPYVPRPTSYTVAERPVEPYPYTRQDTEPHAIPPLVPPQQRTPRKRGGRPFAILLLALVLALVFGVGLFAGWEFTSSRSATTVTSTATTTTTAATTQQEAAIAKVSAAVVELQVTTAQGEQLGSGVIINSNGDIVTNNHVVSGARSIQVLFSDGTSRPAQLVGTSAANDLAVVRIAPFTGMIVATLGDSSKLVVGQEVLAIGSPLGLDKTVTQGIVSALERDVEESANITLENAIQTDAALNPGNSGGALINLQGEVIGIPTLGAVNSESNTVADGLSFAIPSNLVAKVVAQILQQ